VIVLDNIWGDRIDEIWPLLEPCFQKAVDAVHTEWTVEAIHREAKATRLLLWAIYRDDKPLPLLAAMSSAVRERKCGRIAVIEHIGGDDMKAWLRPALEKFEQLARQHGCTRIECEGRMGWARALPGYEPLRVVMGKVL